MPDLNIKIKEMIIKALELEDIAPADIDDSAPLFGEGLGLDSIDALELVLGVEQSFGVKIEDEASGAKAFQSINALVDYINEHKKA